MNDVKIYAVGGYVRDKILGEKPKDLDMVVLTDSFDVMRQVILDRGGEIFLESPKYQTIRARLPEVGAADFALPRRDGEYSDGRRPDSTSITTDLREDASRRDFRFSAMYEDLDTGEILDFFGGREDIKYKVINAVGNPMDRFREDLLRSYRALRFSVTKGFDLSYETSFAISELCNEDFSNISTERIREEIFKMFKADVLKSMEILRKYYFLAELAFKERGIWLKPTTEKRK